MLKILLDIGLVSKACGEGCDKATSCWENVPLVLASLLRPAYEEPVVDIAERVWHEGLRFIMAPLAIHDEFVLVVAAR